jgi:hypothetical protein
MARGIISSVPSPRTAQAAAAPPVERDQVVGFVDIGTNSVRLMLVEIRPNHSYSVISVQREPVRLGEREFGGGRLVPEAIERAVLVCRTFADLASETPLDGAAARALGHDDETIGERRLA